MTSTSTPVSTGPLPWYARRVNIAITSSPLSPPCNLFQIAHRRLNSNYTPARLCTLWQNRVSNKFLIVYLFIKKLLLFGLPTSNTIEVFSVVLFGKNFIGNYYDCQPGVVIFLINHRLCLMGRLLVGVDPGRLLTQEVWSELLSVDSSWIRNMSLGINSERYCNNWLTYRVIISVFVFDKLTRTRGGFVSIRSIWSQYCCLVSNLYQSALTADAGKHCMWSISHCHVSDYGYSPKSFDIVQKCFR